MAGLAEEEIRFQANLCHGSLGAEGRAHRSGDRQRQPCILAIGCRVHPASWGVAVWQGCPRVQFEGQRREQELPGWFK